MLYHSLCLSQKILFLERIAVIDIIVNLKPFYITDMMMI